MIITDLFSKDMCHVCGQTPCNCTHIAESADPQSQKLGRIIGHIYNEIYEMGDDALDYLNDRSHVWAELWDRYEGDIDSIIAEEDPVTLGKAVLELKDILNDLQSDQGVAEEKVRLDPKCWSGKKIGNPKTKMKGGVRVNNCVPAESVAENYDNGEYSDEAGMAHTNLITIARAAEGLLDTIDQHEDLPEWVQEKIAKVQGMLVAAWDYLKSQEAQGIDPRVSEMYANLAENWQRVSHRLELNQEFDLIESIVESIADRNGVDAETVWADLESLTEDELYVFAVTSEPIMEDWQKANKRDKTDGMSQKAVNAYRREHPGSKLKTAVTTKPSKLKKGSKASKRRKSYCSRSRGQMKMHHISCAKTPDKAICKARRRWNCEGVDRSGQTVVAEADKLQGTPVVSLSDFGNKDNTKDRYGRTVPKKLKKDDPRVQFHKEPKKPGVAEMDSQGYKGTRDEGDPYAKGSKATPVKSKDVVKQGVKALNKAHPGYSQHEKKLIGKMSNAEKVDKGWRNPNIDEQGVAEGEAPEKEIERLKLRQNAEHSRASLKRQADTQARIRELEKQVKDKKSGVAEVSDATLTSYLTKVDADSQKHEKDPTKRSAEKRNKSVAGFARAFNKLDARKEKVDEISKDTLGSYVKKAHQDVVDRATSSSFQSGKAGDKYNKADVSGKEQQREKGISRAIDRLAREAKEKEPPEADYGDDYQDMVSRVKKLAGLGPLKTVWDPEKRVYRNVPVTQQPK